VRGPGTRFATLAVLDGASRDGRNFSIIERRVTPSFVCFA